MTQYANWITAYRQRVGDATGRCAEATSEMAAAFPELTRVRGHVPFAGREWTHWWLVSPDGTVIDPTADQFGPSGPVAYFPHDEAGPEPTGKCPNCGGYVYDSSTVCSEACAREYAAYVMRG